METTSATIFPLRYNTGEIPVTSAIRDTNFELEIIKAVDFVNSASKRKVNFEKLNREAREYYVHVREDTFSFKQSLSLSVKYPGPAPARYHFPLDLSANLVSIRSGNRIIVMDEHTSIRLRQALSAHQGELPSGADVQFRRQALSNLSGQAGVLETGSFRNLEYLVARLRRKLGI